MPMISSLDLKSDRSGWHGTIGIALKKVTEWFHQKHTRDLNLWTCLLTQNDERHLILYVITLEWAFIQLNVMDELYQGMTIHKTSTITDLLIGYSTFLMCCAVPSTCDQFAPRSDRHLISRSQVQHIYGVVQNCSNSIANTLELLQSCTRPSIGLVVYEFKIDGRLPL